MDKLKDQSQGRVEGHFKVTSTALRSFGHVDQFINKVDITQKAVHDLVNLTSGQNT